MTPSRSISPNADARPAKRSRVEPDVLAGPVHTAFPDPQPLSAQYQTAQPYKHISAPKLFDDELVVIMCSESLSAADRADTTQLEAVVTEANTAYGERGTESALPGWGFEKKETDIYKVETLRCKALIDDIDVMRWCRYNKALT